MPFIKRKIEPSKLRTHIKSEGEIFEEHSDVANNTLVKALLQLSSLTYHAEDIFREIEEQMKFVFGRCRRLNERIERLNETTLHFNHKEVRIPVSDLNTEYKIPFHLHYQSSDSFEEDLFTIDSRTPCLIHLHQLARCDFDGVFRGSQAFAKPPRPKSFDPNILLQDSHGPSPRHVFPAKSTTNIAVSSNLSRLNNPKALLPTPQEKMERESSQRIAEVISVDTSGAQFERRVNLRRSQRSTFNAVRRKSHTKLKERHKTMSALPGEFGLNGIHRPNSLHSDFHSTSSFLGDSSVVSGDSTFTAHEKQNATSQLENGKLSPASPVKRRLKNRLSMPVFRSAPSSLRGARISLQQPANSYTANQPNAASNKENKRVENGAANSDDQTPARPAILKLKDQKSFIREAKNSVEDRISSGFWSGTESNRHSTTSEILMQHHNVTQALQQVLAKKPVPASPLVGRDSQDDDTNVSTLSINSRLSTLDHSPLSSPSLSLSRSNLTPLSTDIASSPDNSVCIPRAELMTPMCLNFNTPAGAYNFMNPDHVHAQPELQHLVSPMYPLIIGDRRGHDGGLVDKSFDSFDSSFYSQNRDGSSTPKNNNVIAHKQSPFYEDHPVFTPNTPQTPQVCNLTCHPVFTPNTPQTPQVYNLTCRDAPGPLETPNGSSPKKFFGDDYIHHDGRLLRKQMQRHSLKDLKQQVKLGDEKSFQDELKLRLKQQQQDDETDKSAGKPSTPRRVSSLKRQKDSVRTAAYVEPSSMCDKQQLNSPPIRMATKDPLPAYYHVKPSMSSSSPRSTEVKKSDEIRARRHEIVSPRGDAALAPMTKTSKPTAQSPGLRRGGSSSSKKSLSPYAPSPITAASAIRSQQPGTAYQGNRRPFSPRELSRGADMQRRSLFLAHSDSKPLQPFPSRKLSLTSPTSPRVNHSSDDMQFRRLEPLFSSVREPLPSNTVSPINTVMVQSPDKQLFVEKLHSNYQADYEAEPMLLTSSPVPKAPQIVTDHLIHRVENRPPTPSKLPLSTEPKLCSPISPYTNEKLSHHSSKPSMLTISANTRDDRSMVSVTPQLDLSPVSPVKATSNVPILSKSVNHTMPSSPLKNSIETTQMTEKTTVPAPKPPLPLKPPKPPPSNLKPALKPKPTLCPRPIQAKDNQLSDVNKHNQVATNRKLVEDVNTNALSSSSFSNRNSASSKTEPNKAKEQSSTSKKSFKINEKDVNSLVRNSHEHTEEERTEITTDPANRISPAKEMAEDGITTVKVTVKKDHLPLKNDVNNEFSTSKQSNDQVSLGEETRSNENKDPPVLENSDLDSVPTEDKKSPVPLQEPKQNGVGVVDGGADDDDADSEEKNKMTAENIDVPSSTSFKNSDFATSMHKLRSSLRSSDNNAIKSSIGPTSPIDRKSDGRSSISSLERRRKRASGTTSTEDFKALLLQSFSKSASGSQMSAAEKLHMSPVTRKTDSVSNDGEDISDGKTDDAKAKIVSMGDLRAAMSPCRQGRRANRGPEFRLSYAGSTSYSSKKHPPISLSGRYNQRSRTPTRPMMAISEDVENEGSPERPVEERPRSASLGHIF